MSHMWNQDIIVSPALAQKLVGTQSHIRVKTMSYLDKGFDNTVFLINDLFIVRFPHRNFGAACMKHEIETLPYLEQHLSFAIPHLEITGVPTNEYPYPFAGYRKLPGNLLTTQQQPPVQNDTFARTLGIWIKELHAIPILPQHVEMLTNDQAWRLDVSHRQKKVTETVTKYEHLFTENEFSPQLLIDTINSFSSLANTQEHHCYVHGDLYAKHILVDQAGMPSGIIDWGDIHIGNPGLDLAIGYMIFDKKRQDIFFESYNSNIKQDTFKVAQFKALYHSILAFVYFAHEQEKTTLTWTKVALQNTVKSIYKNQ